MTQSARQLPELVSRIESGDPEAEAEFVSRYLGCVRAILLKRTSSIQVASDLSQDTFIIALRRLRAGALENPACLPAFVRQIAVNVSIDHFRRERRYVQRDGDSIAALAFHRDHKGRHIDSQTTKSMLRRAIGQLSVPRDREILRRFYLGDENKEQICADLRLSAPHFDRVLYRARTRMRHLIMSNKGLRACLHSALNDA